MTDDEFDKVLAELYMMLTRQAKEIAGLTTVNAVLVAATYDKLQKCNAEDCDRAGTHSCGGSHKRVCCERHVAIELSAFKTKESFESAKALWRELPNIVVVRALDAYMEAFEGIVPKHLH